MPCAFCTDLSTTGELVFEDASTWVIVHPDWSPRGHVMVVAKQHVENISDVSPDEWGHIAMLFQRVERIVLALTGAQRAIVMKLGIQTPHLHLHLYPMKDDATRGDVFDAIDGKRGEVSDGAFVAALRDALT